MCSFDDVLAHQTQRARYELEHELEARIAAWVLDARIARHLAFARYLRERAERRTTARGRVA